MTHRTPNGVIRTVRPSARAAETHVILGRAKREPYKRKCAAKMETEKTAIYCTCRLV